MLEEYKQAFLSCYPHHNVAVIPKRVRGEVMFRVFINGEGGDTLLSEGDIKSATRMFKRGK